VNLKLILAVLSIPALLILQSAQAIDKAELNKEAVSIVKKFGSTLKPELKNAIMTGGPAHAIYVCSERAPAIAQSLSDDTGWYVNRVSLKPRNSQTAIPDAWERKVLEQFDQRQASGESAEKMAFSEVYGALQQGVVDGQENTWSNIYGKKFFEVQDGVTETNHGIIDYLVVTNVDWLESLDPAVRDQFLKILGEVTATRNAEAFAVNEAAKQSILDAGGTIRQLDATQRQVWVDTMMPVWGQFAGDVGQDKIDAAQAINAGL